MFCQWHFVYSKLTQYSYPHISPLYSPVNSPNTCDLEYSLSSTDRIMMIDKEKIFYGVVLVLGIGVTWTGSTQFAQHVQTGTSITIPPFALMWFTTSFKIFCALPLLIRCCYVNHEQKKWAKFMMNEEAETPQSECSTNSHRGITIKGTAKFRKIDSIFREDYGTRSASNCNASKSSDSSLAGASLHRLLSSHSVNGIESDLDINLNPNSNRMVTLYLLFYALWTGANYSYIRALNTESATIVTAIFSSNNLFIYVLSIIVLNEVFSWWRMGAVLTAIAGILIISLSDLKDVNSHNSSLIGAILALCSSVFAAVYKVYFKKIFGDLNVWSVCRFLSFIGAFNLLFMWIAVLMLHIGGWESMPSEPINQWPWLYIIGSALCGLTFDFLINFGIAFTYPLFIALGIIIGIPINLIVDIFVNGMVLGWHEVLGILCICGGFIVIVVADLHGNSANRAFRK